MQFFRFASRAAWYTMAFGVTSLSSYALLADNPAVTLSTPDYATYWWTAFWIVTHATSQCIGMHIVVTSIGLLVSQVLYFTLRMRWIVTHLNGTDPDNGQPVINLDHVRRHLVSWESLRREYAQRHQRRILCATCGILVSFGLGELVIVLYFCIYLTPGSPLPALLAGITVLGCAAGASILSLGIAAEVIRTRDDFQCVAACLLHRMNLMKHRRLFYNSKQLYLRRMLLKIYAHDGQAKPPPGDLIVSCAGTFPVTREATLWIFLELATYYLLLIDVIGKPDS